MISQAIIDDIESSHRRPERIKVNKETLEWIVLDDRCKLLKFSGTIFIELNGIPVVIDDDLKQDYKVEY